MDTPFVVTGTMEDEVAVECIRQGAADCLLKDRLARLGQAVTRALERGRLQADKWEAERAFQALFEGVPVGLYLATASGRILDANPALVQMVGFPDRQSLLETDVTDLYVDPEERMRLLDCLNTVGIARGFEAQVHRRDGEMIWVRSTARAVRDAEGRLTGLQRVVEDITERKRTEEALARAKSWPPWAGSWPAWPTS